MDKPVDRQRSPPVAPVAQRPFTSLGTSTLHLEATRVTSPRGGQLLEPMRAVTAGARTRPRHGIESAGDFDVRKFLLDQKQGGEGHHHSALFRARGVIADADNQKSVAPRTVGKKLLPRMDTGSSDTRCPRPVTSNPQPEADDYDAISHFYTLEKVSECCLHAVQSKNKTWQFLPGSEERSKSSSGTSANASSGGANSLTNVERPSRRVDILDLERCFETAIHFAHKKNNWEVPCTDHLATIDRDFMAIQNQVSTRFMTLSPLNPEEHPPVESTTDGLTRDQKALVKLLFEQKWSDVILGELEAMLTTSFLEQGMLLRKGRIQYAKAFFRLERLYEDRTTHLNVIVQQLERTRQELREASESHAQDTQLMKDRYEAEIKRLATDFEARRDEMERKVAESKEQMTKMGDTMKTLNTIFRQMREDTEKVKAIELRENLIKLERKFEVYREEVERLRPLVQANQRLEEQYDAVVNENSHLKEKLENFESLLLSKDEAIASLMEQQSEMMAAQELREVQEDERRRQQLLEEEDDDEDGESESTNGVKTGGRRNSAAVCIRCKKSLRQNSEQLTTNPADAVNGVDESATIDVEGHVAGAEPKKRRVQCLYFRILLPNLRGRRPQRDSSWTYCCIRSILFAKQVDDSMSKRSGGSFPMRIRMPEFVYAWFSPWKPLKEEKRLAEEGAGIADGGDDGIAGDEADASNGSRRGLEQRQQVADEDRWCLYYGVKTLVQEGSLEAKLFLSLLDEKYGEDEQVFMLYCYRILDVLIGGKLNWGPLRSIVSYEAFSNEYSRLFDRGADPEQTPKVPKTIWISPYHAALATSVVLSKATAAEREALSKKLQEYAVSNLSALDRPSIYLTPTSARALHIVDSITRKKHHARQKRTAESEEDPVQPPDDDHLQFIDAHLWVELMMMEYKEEQAHRRAAVRLMFQTAVATSSAVMKSGSAGQGATMDMEQFRIMVRTLNDEIPSFAIAMLFRTAFVRGNGLVSFDSFIQAADESQFFSSCMRLDNPTSCIARLTEDTNSPTLAAQSTSSRAAYMVDKLFTLLQHEVNSAVASLPLWTRSLTDGLAFEISAALTDNDNPVADGFRLLTSFHRLLDGLLAASLTKKEIVGGALSSKNVFTLERALQSLLDCVRVGGKTTVELLIDAVKQKLAVKRVQFLFRRHLLRDEGAPLAMRPLMHHGYGSNRTGYSTRHAERPLKWLLFAISDVLRKSLKSDRLRWLLSELSTTSAVLLPASGHQQFLSAAKNGGIGPTPKPLLMEVIYDYFLEKFGTRWEAEKLIHDVFVNCRAFVQSVPLVHLFACLCSMSAASPDDRILGLNEALVFLHAIFRCGLHDFHIINPPEAPDDEAWAERPLCDDGDIVSQAVAERIFASAFGKLDPDHLKRQRNRILEHLTIRKKVENPTTTGDTQLFMPADAFLVFALNEWKRYLLQRMNDLRMACCQLESELPRFESLLHVDFVASVLQKANVTFSNDELCAVYRRVCLTEPPRGAKGKGRDASSTTTSATNPRGPGEAMSDRIAAACFPLLAREALAPLEQLEHDAPEPFRLAPLVREPAKFLLETWRGYHEPCRLQLEELRRLGKQNDIQAESIARRVPLHGGRAIQREVLYLSSSTSADRLSSQDVAQLDALFGLFLERLERLGDELEPPSPSTGDGGARGPLTRLRDDARGGDGLLLLDARVGVVNEVWKMLRQVLVGFSRLRAVAGLGIGPLPDRWDPQMATATAAGAAAVNEEEAEAAASATGAQ